MLKPLTLITMCMLLLVACGGAATPTATQPAATTAGTESTATAAQQDIYASLPQSTTADGYYVLGKPDAPVVMTMYSDLL